MPVPLEDICVRPEQFGAIGDGVADDTAAVQRALSEATWQVSLSGRYRVTQPLNVTNRAFGGLRILGSGMREDAQGCALLGETGGVVLDCTGSQYITMSDFSILAYGTRPSTCGVLLARSGPSPYCQFNVLHRLHIDMGSDLAANGGHGTIAVYNNAAELFRTEDSFCLADVPMVFTAENLYGIHSPHTSWNPTITSMSMCTVTGTSALIGRRGPALLLEHAFNMRFANVYLSRRGSGGTSSAIRSYGAHCVDFIGHVEEYPSFLSTHGVERMWHIRGTQLLGPNPAVSLEAAHPGASPEMIGCDIDLFPMPGSQPHDLLGAIGTTGGVRGCRLALWSGQGLSGVAPVSDGGNEITTRSSAS